MLRSEDVLLALAIAEQATPLRGERTDYQPFLDAIGEARFVLLGEASHGTHEFYRARAEITKRLIAEHGFQAVAAEADWPDAYRVNRYVQGRSIAGRTPDAEAIVALADFRRFPQWMWRNAEVLDFIGWLRAYDERRPERERAGFYGLDLYSMHGSMAAVLDYLDRVDPDSARLARDRYSCFDLFGEAPEEYGYAAGLGISPSCEADVVSALIELQQRQADYLARDGLIAEDEYFQAEQNARVVKGAEEYYRAMFGRASSTWNLRDTHMADTLDALAAHVSRQRGGAPAKIVVWAHNSHLGDARFTEMSTRGELNLGQLVRQRHGGEAALVGFTTYTGTVAAATDWGGPVERKRVRPALAGSYERFFHEVAIPAFFLDLRRLGEVAAALGEPRLERAIGVIYRPDTERTSHYFASELPRQFDAVFHFDETRAVEPLERSAGWEAGELPETYPRGL